MNDYLYQWFPIGSIFFDKQFQDYFQLVKMNGDEGIDVFQINLICLKDGFRYTNNILVNDDVCHFNHGKYYIKGKVLLELNSNFFDKFLYLALFNDVFERKN